MPQASCPPQHGEEQSLENLGVSSVARVPKGPKAARYHSMSVPCPFHGLQETSGN